MTSDEQDWGTPDEDWGYDGENFGEGDLKRGGTLTIDKEGKYHLEVTEVTPELDMCDKDGNPRSPSVLFIMTVLKTAPDQSPEGHKLFHRIYLKSKDGSPPSETAQKSALKLGVALGLLECIEVDGRSITVVKATKSHKIPVKLWAEAKGRQVIGRVKYEPPSGDFKAKYAVPFGDFWHVSDPEVADVPKDEEALASIGIKASSTAAANGSANNATPAAVGAGAQQPPFAADDDLGDL